MQKEPCMFNITTDKKDLNVCHISVLTLQSQLFTPQTPQLNTFVADQSSVTIKCAQEEPRQNFKRVTLSKRQLQSNYH